MKPGRLIIIFAVLLLVATVIGTARKQAKDARRCADKGGYLRKIEGGHVCVDSRGKVIR